MDKSNDQVDRTIGRPTSAERGETTRKAITDAAMTLIGELGWGQVTTRAIAERAGVPHGAVGYHFRGKQEVLRAAAATATSEIFAGPIALVREAASVEDVLTGTSDWYTQGGMSDPSTGLFLEVLREAARDEWLREHIAELERDYRSCLAELVRRDQERGDVVRGPSAQGLATLLAALLDGLLLQLVVDPGLDLDAVESALGRLLYPEQGDA